MNFHFPHKSAHREVLSYPLDVSKDWKGKLILYATASRWFRNTCLICKQETTQKQCFFPVYFKGQWLAFYRVVDDPNPGQEFGEFSKLFFFFSFQRILSFGARNYRVYRTCNSHLNVFFIRELTVTISNCKIIFGTIPDLSDSQRV